MSRILGRILDGLVPASIWLAGILGLLSFTFLVVSPWSTAGQTAEDTQLTRPLKLTELERLRIENLLLRAQRNNAQLQVLVDQHARLRADNDRLATELNEAAAATLKAHGLDGKVWALDFDRLEFKKRVAVEAATERVPAANAAKKEPEKKAEKKE